MVFLIYNDDYTIITFLPVFFGAISSAILLYILIYICLYIFKFTNKLIIYMSSFIFVLINISLIVDFLIFRLYKFHINAMVLNIITSPDAMDSIELGVFPVVVFLSIIISFIFFEIYFIKKILSRTAEENLAINKKMNNLLTIPFILIFLGEKLTYGVATLINKNEIITKFKVIPLYQPLTFNRLAAKLFDYKPVPKVENTINRKASLNYPLNPIILSENSNKFNIFIFASDAVRNSVINRDVTPNIEEFKKDAYTFNNHHSGGNATRFGIFSLIYGINSTYWFSFLSSTQKPVLFDVLKQLDYQIDIISSTNTNWPEFRKTCYIDILGSIKDDFNGKPWEKDKQSTEYFLNIIDKYKKDKPIFSFVFLDAPHGYSYPKEFNKFKASDTNINYLTVSKDGKDIKSVFSRYKNSVNYNDALFLKMINKLKENNLYENSMIIYTSDHGQEFYEYGFFGHNSSFSKAQTNSPLIIKLPKNINNINLPDNYANNLTSHNDIVPSILSMIGIKNNPEDYSNGQNLFSKDFKRDFVFSANWNNNAIITNDFIYVFSNSPNKMFNNEVRDKNTYKKLKETSPTNTKMILSIMNENRKFLK